MEVIMAANEKKYSFYKKVGYFLSKEIEGILPCKHCGGFPILIRENSTGEITNAFSCSCQENHSTPTLKNFLPALEIWNSKNKLPFPNAREFNMLNYVGIVVNPRTFQRFSRWKKNNGTDRFEGAQRFPAVQQYRKMQGFLPQIPARKSRPFLRGAMLPAASPCRRLPDPAAAKTLLPRQ